jgi:hypothetical protein
MTIGMDLGYVRTVLVHATAIHGIVTPRMSCFWQDRRYGGRASSGKRGSATEGQHRSNWIALLLMLSQSASDDTAVPDRQFAVARAMRLDEICQL